MYLFTGQGVRGGQGERALICSFTPQLALVAMAELDQRWVVGIESRSAPWVARIHLLGSSLLSPKICISRKQNSGAATRRQTQVLQALCAS